MVFVNVLARNGDRGIGSRRGAATRWRHKCCIGGIKDSAQRPSRLDDHTHHGAACRQPPDQAGEPAQPAATAAAYLHMAILNRVARLLSHLSFAHAL